MQLRLIDCPPFTTPRPSYEPGDCWYARESDAWRCKACGCIWRENPPTDTQPSGSWSLFDEDQVPRSCCDNTTMDLERVYYWWADGSRKVKPASHPYPDVAPEHAGKRPMIVVLPTGPTHCLHAPTWRDGKAGPSGWTVVGELPNVTVGPSINYGAPESPFHWHGFIKNGVME